MFPPVDYVAGLFDGEGSITLLVTKWRDRNYCTANIRIANSNRQVLELISKQFGGVLHTYQPRYPGARLNHVLHLHKQQRKIFLEAITPYLIVKRNLAWITRCFLERGMRKRWVSSHKGRKGFQRLSDDDLLLRIAVRELARKINSRKGKSPSRVTTAIFETADRNNIPSPQLQAVEH